MCHKKKLKFQDYIICLEAAQIENKGNHSEKNKIQADCLKEYQKEFIENIKLIWKIQQKLWKA